MEVSRRRAVSKLGRASAAAAKAEVSSVMVEAGARDESVRRSYVVCID